MNLAAYLLTFLIQHVPPGQTQYSLEVMPDCGTDKLQATCELSRVCAEPGVLCSPPFWAESKKAWVRFESADAAKLRYAVIAEIMEKQGRAALESGIKWAGWNADVRLWSLVGMSAAVAIHESYLREDVQMGRGRSRPKHTKMIDFGEGRGPGNEAGFWQPHPVSTWAFMGYAERPKHDYLSALVGEGSEPIERAQRLFYKMISHTRSHCSGINPPAQAQNVKFKWAYRAISLYGTGRSCDSWNGGKTYFRYRTFETFMAGAVQ